jgi:hypothetical protein
MHSQSRTGLLVLMTIFLMLTVNATAASRTFNAHLTGRNEVPPVATKAQGEATLRLNDGRTSMTYRVNVAGLENATAAHIHSGTRGQNGPIVVTLFSGLKPGRFSGVLARGTITSANLEGQLAGQPLSALVRLIRSGQAYVNVHTQKYPAGEIRGQLRQSGEKDESGKKDEKDEEED